MRITITLILAFFLASCSSVKNCGVKPNVEIVLEKQTKTGEENKSTADIIKESVQPGGQINCSF
jgi:uncharacterized protein YcfL